MRVGTKSVLFGAHQFMIHPLFVAAAWTRLYGWPRDPRLWLAFALHDVGYLGKPNMDGVEGEQHVELGARIMERLFGRAWGDFCRYHSRFWAKAAGKPFSRLCVADKLSVVLMPRWLYLLLVRLSGEGKEYMARCADGKYASISVSGADLITWHASMIGYLALWCAAHKDGGVDNWTPGGTK